MCNTTQPLQYQAHRYVCMTVRHHYPTVLVASDKIKWVYHIYDVLGSEMHVQIVHVSEDSSQVHASFRNRSIGQFTISSSSVRVVIEKREPLYAGA